MERLIETTLGPARLTVSAAAEPRAVLWLGHGAGGGIDSPDLTALAGTLPRDGVTVIRHEQPWRVAGKKVAVRPPLLDAGWLESSPAVVELTGGLPLLVGGRSAGARVACRTAGVLGAAGVVCLGFPLHPPARPDRSRLDELLRPEVPVLVVQGDRDTFGSAFRIGQQIECRPNVRLVPVADADHSLRVPVRSGVDALGIVTSAVGDFVGEVVRGI